MQRSSGRGGTEPLAALVAVGVVCSALSLYAGILPVPPSTDRKTATAERLLDRVYERAGETGVVCPGRLGDALRSAGQVRGQWRVNVSVESGTTRWQHGPNPPGEVDSAESATRRVSVRHPLGQVRPGRLRVVVW